MAAFPRLPNHGFSLAWPNGPGILTDSNSLRIFGYDQEVLRAPGGLTVCCCFQEYAVLAGAPS
jgi:hypothetical protein